MLSRDEIVSTFQLVLGRPPRADELDQLAADMSLEQLLGTLLGCEEYAALLRRRAESTRDPAYVNIYRPDLAAWGFPPGLRSEDGVAIVGREGWLFLCGGTNANLGQYVGAVQMEPGWLGEWQAVIDRRDADARELGVTTALLVVPDKLPVYEEHYPEPLTRTGPRPIERLLSESDIPVIYPLQELRAAAAAGEEVYLRTDTHLTLRGNELLFASTLPALGVERPPDLSQLPLRSYPSSGDLGIKFRPQILNIITEPGSMHLARIVEDNHEQIAAVEGHIGTRRVFVNEQAADRRVAVVFGDSYGNGIDHYQGLSWFMAQVFREVHFVWVPFGWDADYVRRVGAEAVLIQGAERFVPRVPHANVDALGLAEQTVRRKQPVGIEHVSG